MLVLVGVAAALMRRSLAWRARSAARCSLLGLATAFVGICYLSSVAFIPVTVAAVMFYTFPILIVLASPFVEGTRLTPTLLGVVAVATLGVVLVVGPAFGDLDWRGLALAFAASVATAVQFFAAARCRKTGVVAKVFWIHLLVLPTAALVGAASPGSSRRPRALAARPGRGRADHRRLRDRLRAAVRGARAHHGGGGRDHLLRRAGRRRRRPRPSSWARRLCPLQIAGGALVLAAIVANVLLERAARRTPPSLPTRIEP